MRKSKEFYEVTLKIIKAVERLAGKGCHMKDIAVSIGWGKTKFYKSLEESTELTNALRKGQSKRVVTLISRLAKRADGYNYKEQRKTK